MNKNLLRACLAGSVLLLAGCYDHAVAQGKHVYTFQIWVPFAAALGGVALAGLGLLFATRNQNGWRGLLAIVVGAGIVFGVAPGMFRDRVVVADDHLSLTTGYWFDPTQHDIWFEQVASMRVDVEVKQSRRGRKSSYKLDFLRLNGTHERFPVGTLMEQAMPEILHHVRRSGVPITLPPGLPSSFTTAHNDKR